MKVGPNMPVVLFPVSTFCGAMSPIAGAAYQASVDDAEFATYTAPAATNGDGVSNGIGAPDPPLHAPSASTAATAKPKLAASRTIAIMVMVRPRVRWAS